MAWQMDPNHSRVGWSVKHYGINIIHGYFGKVDATLDFTGDDPTQWSVAATIDATSVESACAARDHHLRTADYLDVEQYPTITFRSKRVEPANGHYRVVGDLTIHGVTREVTLDGQFHGEATDNQGKQRRGFSATGTIRRSDFGVGAPAGAPSAVADELQLTIDSETVNQE
ncbi:MAG TPA: YceI family protein [Chloroflexota bacterium]|nr:YceI family protein [Chloroflexota bacterium]